MFYIVFNAIFFIKLKCIIVSIKGALFEAKRDDHHITRNASFFKKLSLHDMDNDDNDDLYDDSLNEYHDLNIHRYPVKTRRPVNRYGQNIYNC